LGCVKRREIGGFFVISSLLTRVIAIEAGEGNQILVFIPWKISEFQAF